MIRHLIVPVDGSPDSWRAFDVALSLARRCRSDLRVVEVACDPVDGRYAKKRLDSELARRVFGEVDVIGEVRQAAGSVAEELARVVSDHPDAIVVMSSRGNGRSAAIVGSVADDLLRQTQGPIVLVGPNVEAGDFSGPIVASVDGSAESELALPLAVAWSTDLRASTWIVNVVTPETSGPNPEEAVPSTYVAGLAKDLANASGHAVEFDELHGFSPARAVPAYAARHGASLIVASSHGRGGLSRLAMGSVVAGFVRHAICPVVVVRLPHPEHAERPEWMWAYCAPA